MKKLLYRIVAFVLDLALVSFFILGLTMLDFVNPNNEEINLKYQSIYNNRNKYEALRAKIDEYTEDAMISVYEEAEIKAIYKDYYSILDDIKVGEDLTNQEISTMKDKIERLNSEISNELVISVNKLNAPSVIISLVIYILYFGVLQYVLKGQTLFKRLFRLKVIRADRSGKRVGLLSFIIRAVLITEIVISIADLILVNSLGVDSYVVVNYWLTQGKYIYELAFVVSMIVRNDGRSIDDMILRTDVIRYDKRGKIIEESLFNEVLESDHD